jgi:hypothetical protein
LKLEELRDNLQRVHRLGVTAQLCKLLKEIKNPQPPPPVELFRAFAQCENISHYRQKGVIWPNSNEMSHVYLILYESTQYTVFSFSQYSHLIARVQEGSVLDAAGNYMETRLVTSGEGLGVVTPYSLRPLRDVAFIFAPSGRMAPSSLPVEQSSGVRVAWFISWPHCTTDGLLKILNVAREVRNIHDAAYSIIVNYIRELVEEK